MKNSQMESITKRVEEAEYGHVFVLSDFSDLADYQNIKKCLSRLEREGLIRRILRGVYDKPFYSSLVGEYSSPSPSEVAKGIARNYGWKIAPNGLFALNAIGLSTQVPNCYDYRSSGPYKTYTVGNIAIRYRHTSSKDLLPLSYKSSVVVQAIKELGGDLDEAALSKIRSSLSEEEKRTLLMESHRTTKWVRGVIEKICA